METSKTSTRVTIPDRLYFRIGDVAELLDVKPHVLRYWETEFSGVSPQKSATGQRVYRRVDVETLALIRDLLYRERYSIEGARQRIKDLKRGGQLDPARKALVDNGARDALKEAREVARELQALARTPITEWFRA